MLKGFLLFATLLFLLSLQPFEKSHAEEKDTYICPMECKNLEFDKPGNCPVCGMDLVEKAAFLKQDTRKKVGILIFDGVQIIDYTAPYEVFGQADCNVFTIAETKQPITTSMNMTVTPKYDFASAPQVDILVVPGGSIDSPINSAKTIQWIKETSAKAQYVLSVCNGAFLLAKSGLLDGLSATTFYGLLDELTRQATKTKVVRNQRFVDNGKIITTAGLSSGFDGSLHVVSKIRGKGEAQQIALHLEYNWQPDSKFARAALADMNVPNIGWPDGTQWKFLRTEGTTDHWEMDGLLRTDMTKEELLNHIRTGLVARANWKETKTKQSPVNSNWTFSDRDGNPWKANVQVQTAEKEQNAYVIKLVFDRAGTAQAFK
ncbi:DJ-1/PfpI family protein [bacterium]|nr:DJ-1/PfpI family protein [bacterium]MCI0604911.1 DJ-1/PfpI family protein [bacterium]